MDEQRRLQLAAEIRHIFPNSVNPPPGTSKDARRHPADDEIRETSRKKARRSNGRGGNATMQRPVRALINFTR